MIVRADSSKNDSSDHRLRTYKHACGVGI